MGFVKILFLRVLPFSWTSFKSSDLVLFKILEHSSMHLSILVILKFNLTSSPGRNNYPFNKSPNELGLSPHM